VAKGKVAMPMVWQAHSVQDVRERARWLGQQVHLGRGTHLLARWLGQQVHFTRVSRLAGWTSKGAGFAAKAD
jgi:hypothetical protein